MAKESSYFKQIYSLPKPTGIGMGNLGIGLSDPNAGRVVVDPWNNKFYGEDNKNSYMQHFTSQIKSLQETLRRGYTETHTPSPFGMGWGGSVQRNPLDEAGKLNLQKQIEDISKQSTEFDQNYVQSRDFFASYDAYKSGWDNFFEASYRNPRMEAEQKTGAIEKTEQYKAQVEEANNKAQLASANQLEIQAPRQVGTGVSAAKDTSINQLLSNGGTGLGL